MHFIMANDGGFELKLTNDWIEREGGVPKGLWSFELKRNFSTGTELQIHKTSGAELQIHKILGIVEKLERKMEKGRYRREDGEIRRKDGEWKRR